MAGPRGKSCCPNTDDNSGHLWHLADNIEAALLGVTADLQQRAAEVVGDSNCDSWQDIWPQPCTTTTHHGRRGGAEHAPLRIYRFLRILLFFALASLSLRCATP